MIRYRAARMRDADLLLRWRNDPGTMEFSVVPERVSTASHEQWLRHSLLSTDRLLAIAMEDSGPIGTFRLDHLHTKSVEVSVTVAPECRGNGLATPLIQVATEVAFFPCFSTERVLARIHEGNVRSLRAFDRAGYRRTGEASGTSPARFLLYVATKDALDVEEVDCAVRCLCGRVRYLCRGACEREQERAA